MATYNSHKLIMGKEEIDNVSVSIGVCGILFLQKCLLNSSLRFIRLLSKSLNLIGCRGDKGFYIHVKNSSSQKPYCG